MKTLFSLLILLVLASCDATSDYKYKIKGKIYVPTSGVNPLHDAVWYTNSIHLVNDTLIYYNSDGSEVRINPPFTIDTLK
jgi:hypothetical protein